MTLKTLTEERAARKWANWSAHFAWGALIAILWSFVFPEPQQEAALFGWAFSFLVGCIWEIGGWLIKDWVISVIDFVTWALGALTGTLLWIWLG